MPPPETPGHSQASLARSLVGSVPLSPGFWCTQSFVCAHQEFISPVLWKFCNQIPLAFKVKFPEDSQSLCWIPRLGNLLWALELSQQCENSFGITVSSLWVVCSVALWWGYRSCLLGLWQPEPLFSRQATANPCLRRRYSNNPRQVRLSLLQGPWVLVCTRFYLSPLSVSDGYGGLILNGLWPSYHLTGASPFSLDVGYLVFAGIQHSPVNGCSAVSCNFGVHSQIYGFSSIHLWM